MDGRHGCPDRASQHRSPVADERLERCGRRQDSSGHEHPLEEWAGGAHFHVLGLGVDDLPAEEMVRCGGRGQLEPQHMSVCNQHDQAQPGWSAMEPGPNHLLRRSGVVIWNPTLEGVGVVVSLYGYARSPLYESHFLPIDFSMRG